MLKSAIKGYQGEDILDYNNIFHGIIDIKTRDRLIYDLYYEMKNIGLGLSYFLNQTITDSEYESIKDDEEKQLDITLDYLYPLLKEGKLKVRVGNYKEKIGEDGRIIFEDSLGWNLYKNNESDKAILDIKEKWRKITDKRFRSSVFESQQVQFTLPENTWA